MRICDLGLRIEGSELQKRTARLHKELRERGLMFRPHFWLSDEWFCPDGIPGIAIPFFLAHPRLRELEQRHMLDVEGGTENDCMKLLRHETGHAIVNAYQVHRKRGWRHHFGKASVKYPDTYLPRPYSKRFVIHLEHWYAQSHPHEDWAETFAVWLAPNFDWRKRYQGWRALKKLEYVDQLMGEIGSQRPRITTRRTEHPARLIRLTLREYYRKKQARYGTNSPEFYDRDLRRLFSDKTEHKTNEKASRYIRRVRMEVMDIVSRWTAEYNYRINEVLNDMIRRCDELDLHVAQDDESMKLQIVTCVTTLVMHQLHSGGFHVSI
ncbi:MAG: putative zinc-binding metallopeptidase [Acidiferrobacterales bacterium]